MKGVACTVFLEYGDTVWRGEGKAIAPLTESALVEMMASVTSGITSFLSRNGGWRCQDMGVYVEMYEVPPALQSWYELATRLGGKKANRVELEWNADESRAARARREGGNNGQV